MGLALLWRLRPQAHSRRAKLKTDIKLTARRKGAKERLREPLALYRHCINPAQGTISRRLHHSKDEVNPPAFHPRPR